jgi:hypothetical protein
MPCGQAFRLSRGTTLPRAPLLSICPGCRPDVLQQLHLRQPQKMLECIAIFSPSLGKREEDSANQILYFYPAVDLHISTGKIFNLNEQIREVGLAQALVQLCGMFSRDSNGLATSLKSKRVIQQVEDGYWIALKVVDPPTGVDWTGSQRWISQAYDAFCLVHGSFARIIAMPDGLNLLKASLVSFFDVWAPRRWFSLDSDLLQGWAEYPQLQCEAEDLQSAVESVRDALNAEGVTLSKSIVLWKHYLAWTDFEKHQAGPFIDALTDLHVSSSLSMVPGWCIHAPIVKPSKTPVLPSNPLYGTPSSIHLVNNPAPQPGRATTLCLKTICVAPLPPPPAPVLKWSREGDVTPPPPRLELPSPKKQASPEKSFLSNWANKLAGSPRKQTPPVVSTFSGFLSGAIDLHDSDAPIQLQAVWIRENHYHVICYRFDDLCLSFFVDERMPVLSQRSLYIQLENVMKNQFTPLIPQLLQNWQTSNGVESFTDGLKLTKPAKDLMGYRFALRNGQSYLLRTNAPADPVHIVKPNMPLPIGTQETSTTVPLPFREYPDPAGITPEMVLACTAVQTQLLDAPEAREVICRYKSQQSEWWIAASKRNDQEWFIVMPQTPDERTYTLAEIDSELRRVFGLVLVL